MNESCVILNPTADKGAALKTLPKIKAILNTLGIVYDLKITAYAGHAIHLAMEACSDGYGTVIAAGGDGTAHEVMNGLMQASPDMETRPSLAVLPVGRGNDFSFGMGLPQDLESACKLLVDQKTRQEDIGFLRGGDYPKGRFFGNGIGIGFDTKALFEAEKLPNFISGIPSYLLSALKTIFLYFHAPMIRLEIDGKEMEQPCLQVSLMNGQRLGGTFYVTPTSVTDDGRLNICLIGQVSRVKALGLLKKIISGTHANDPAVTMLTGHNIRIKALTRSLPVHADGETICEAGDELEIKILPGQLNLVSD